MNGPEQNRRWVPVPMYLVTTVDSRMNVTAQPSYSDEDDDDDDYIDAGLSLRQQQQQQQQPSEDRQVPSDQSTRYVASAVRRSVVTEAEYSQLDVSDRGRSCCRRSICCRVTAVFVSLLLNITMSVVALGVIVSQTSPGSHVICTLLQTLNSCHRDSNCTTLSTDSPASHGRLVDHKVNDALSTILNKTWASETVREQVSLQCAAHLFFVYNEHVSHRQPCTADMNESVRLTNWDDGGNHAFIRACITADLSRGEITVKRTGHYVFYSHLAVCRCAGHTGFQQTVYRRPVRGAGDPQILLEDYRSGRSEVQGQGCVGEPTFTSDLFAVVELEDGDSIWIEAKPASAVYRPNSASFFGLYQLSFF